MIKKLDTINGRILDETSILQTIAHWRLKSKRIVFTNGCFDILHLGHVDYLSKAADCGDVLIVGVNTDESVKKLQKGPARPINNEKARATLVAALHFVDAVIIFNDDTPYNLIKLIQPDVLVKGADYTVDKVVGSDIVLANGGEIKLIPLVEGYSTTAIEKKLRKV